MKYYCFLILLLLLSSCIKEESSFYSADLFNNTQHFITILPYKNGSVKPEDTIKLKPGEQLSISSGTDKKIVNGGGFTSANFGNSDDSVKVVFDKTISITHYCNEPQNISSRYYLYASDRNIMNFKNFKYEFVGNSRFSRVGNYSYVFIEQDYIYGQ